VEIRMAKNGIMRASSRYSGWWQGVSLCNRKYHEMYAYLANTVVAFTQALHDDIAQIATNDWYGHGCCHLSCKHVSKLVEAPQEGRLYEQACEERGHEHIKT